MATRAFEHLKNVIILTRTVKSGSTIPLGTKVVFVTDDNTVDPCGAADDLAIGTSISATTVGDGIRTIQIALDFIGVVKMLVGTGDSTRGKKQKTITAGGGITDAGTSGVTTATAIAGVALQSGVAGDYIAVGILNCRGAV